jgi:hypothetical protein
MNVDITIVKAVRNQDTHLPQEIIRQDEVLVKGIEQYCLKNNLQPIYIHDCVAYPEEV